MTLLENLQSGAQVRGIIPDQIVTLINVQRHGTDAIEVVFRQSNGQLGSQLLFRENESQLELATETRRWPFDQDGAALRLVSEAYRIHLAHLFDPLLAVHTSLIEPLPHQITAVYEEMLTRQPLRFLLADDPGAGKTIMAGLLIRELLTRGDVRRCLICAPGSLTEQWQDELWTKFHLSFDILTREMVEASRSGNPFAEKELIIVRLDQVSRSDELQARLKQTDWDLIICDEAHKMSASYFGNDLKETKRHKLGRLLGEISRHYLLMTATPHNGKEADFQLFMSLLDADRFEGKPRDNIERVDVSDLMRRMIKERLLKFDGTPLFPERRAYTVNYTLSEEENALYEAVTEYVRQEFNRAEKLDSEKRKGTVGFALTVLQRRLASSPEAIYQSLKRRRERLEKKLQEARMSRHYEIDGESDAGYDEEDWDDIDDAPDAEIEQLEMELIDNATAARTIDELQAEILSLGELERMALSLRRSSTDRKWAELKRLMQDTPEMRDAARGYRKLVIFTEHRDTLNYLYERLSTLTGLPEGIACIHGGLAREARRAIEAQFKENPDVFLLIATDAAGEGINLQRAHLMVNYDLPWNPNRLEQRFGRIHRIGQTEVCHLWNLVAGETREGHVYQRLLTKLEAERHALDGQVFDVLGKLFQDTPLRKLLVDAVRYGDDPQVRARLLEAVDNAVDQDRVRDLLEKHSLVTSALDTSQIMRIREDMERAAARRLQPHYIKSFFAQALERLGGSMNERETGRHEIRHVPAIIRTYARERGMGAIATQYERICFDKALIHVPDRPMATFVCPGHPLLDAVIGLTLERGRDVLNRGAVLIDPTDPGRQPRVLLYLEQALQDASVTRSGERHTISREVHFVEIGADGTVNEAGGAPYLDYRPATEAERAEIQRTLASAIPDGDMIERIAQSYAVATLAPKHLERVRKRRLELIARTEAAVQERLTREINFWDYRANELRAQEKAGKVNAKLNSQRAQERADRLLERLNQRKEQLARERQISAAPPVIVGGALIVPAGALLGDRTPPEMLDRRITEQIAMQAVIHAEIALGHEPKDVSKGNVGYDIESRERGTGRLRMIEVKGRRSGAETVTITRNEILTALNQRDYFILALVEVDGTTPRPPRYLRRPFTREPDEEVASVNFNLRDLLSMSTEPG